MSTSSSDQEQDQEQQRDQDDLYEVLGLQDSREKATAAEVRKAYLRLARLHHPDKASSAASNEDSELSNERARFQAISRAYEVLSDENKRRVYDRTGRVDDGSGDPFADAGEDFDWEEYWRAMYQKVSDADIEAFASTYRGSEAEKEDIGTAFEKCDGDFVRMIDYIPLCDTQDDIRRIAGLVGGWLSDPSTASASAKGGDDEDYDPFRDATPEQREAYTSSLKKALSTSFLKGFAVSAPTPSAVEAEKTSASASKKGAAPKGKTSSKKPAAKPKKRAADDGPDLASMILARKQQRAGALDAMFAKYGVDPSDEPDEDAFQAARERVDRQRAKPSAPRNKKPRRS